MSRSRAGFWTVGLLSFAIGSACAEQTAASSAKTAVSGQTPSAVKQVAAQSGEYDFGDFSSQTLTTKAWNAFTSRDFAAVEAYTKKCISLYESKAVEQQASLTQFAPKEKAFNYWALNDVGTCIFILGKTYLVQGKVKEAQEAFRTVVDRFAYAQAWDTKGWFWKVAEGASDQLATIGTAYDFGDYTSETLTTKAWRALIAKDHKGVELFTKKCIELYEEEAKKQQASLTNYAEKGKEFNYWALNDVATCYFIYGQSLADQKRFQEAKSAYQRVMDDFKYAQCWDPQGWFWKVSEGAFKKIQNIAMQTGGGLGTSGQ